MRQLSVMILAIPPFLQRRRIAGNHAATVITGAAGSFLTEYLKKLTLIPSWQAALLGSYKSWPRFSFRHSIRRSVASDGNIEYYMISAYRNSNSRKSRCSMLSPIKMMEHCAEDVYRRYTIAEKNARSHDKLDQFHTFD
jgi:hypothetical protein